MYDNNSDNGRLWQNTGPTSQVLGNMRYSPFGELVEMNGPSPMFGFTGEQQNVANNLTYLQARYYNPALGRFLTPDSLIPDVTNGQSLNAYAYVYNDPINMVDPSGHIGIPGGIPFPILPTPIVPTAVIKAGAQKGIEGLDWWYNKPDNCSCERQPLISVSGAGFANDWVLNQSTQAGWSLTSSPGKRIASEVIGRVNGQVYGYKTGYDVTKWGRSGPVGNPRYNVSYFDKGYIVSGEGGASLKVRNPRWQWAEGNRGAMGSVAGAGIIDGVFQLISDTLISQLCLSPNQIFWRASVAIAFGLAAGTVGLGAGAIAAAVFGATGITVSAISFGVSFLSTVLLNSAKQNQIRNVTPWAGAYD